MATDKLFTVAGISTLNGEVKLRFANDVMRVKLLTKKGHTNILMVELPNAMTKREAVQFLDTIEEFQTVEAKSAIADYLAENQPKQAKPKAVKKERVETKPEVESSAVDQVIDQVVADFEDQPF